MTRAAVFAYQNVGVRCLSVLLDHNVDIPLVVTHNDSPAENIWFDSVKEFAARHGIPAVTPDDPNVPVIVAQVCAFKPDFLFSFYYRHMLNPDLLQLAPRGALNMHGSLLPNYRGRAPVNWAVINGETETGATLHYMTGKPDAGDIVDQQAVAILPDDTALDVFHKVTAAAEGVLARNLPALIAGNAPRKPQDLALGSYFGGRKPADGRINWDQTAARVHNLVRGVAPPYPGAFTELGGKPLRILRTQLEPGRVAHGAPPAIYADQGSCFAICADRSVFRVLKMEYEGSAFTAQDFLARFGGKPISLEAPVQ